MKKRTWILAGATILAISASANISRAADGWGFGQDPKAKPPGTNSPAAEKPVDAAAADSNPAPAASGRPGGGTIKDDEFWQMLDQGKYQQVMPLLNKALALKGDAAKPYDRYELLVIKGEAAMHLKSRQVAIDAFREAAKAAGKPEDAAIAKATSVLVEASSEFKYLPKTGEKAAKPVKGIPVDIIPVESRKEAFAALFADLMAKAKPKIAAATNATTLPQLIAAMTAAGDIRPVEIASTGSDSQSKEMLKDVAGRAQQMLSDAVASLGDQARTADAQANERSRYVVVSQDGMSDVGGSWVQGLTPQIRSQLQQIIANANQAASAAGDMALSAGDSADFSAVKMSALQVVQSATQTLNANYHSR